MAPGAQHPRSRRAVREAARAPRRSSRPPPGDARQAARAAPPRRVRRRVRQRQQQPLRPATPAPLPAPAARSNVVPLGRRRGPATPRRAVRLRGRAPAARRAPRRRPRRAVFRPAVALCPDAAEGGARAPQSVRIAPAPQARERAAHRAVDDVHARSRRPAAKRAPHWFWPIRRVRGLRRQCGGHPLDAQPAAAAGRHPDATHRRRRRPREGPLTRQTSLLRHRPRAEPTVASTETKPGTKPRPPWWPI